LRQQDLCFDLDTFANIQRERDDYVQTEFFTGSLKE